MYDVYLQNVSFQTVGESLTSDLMSNDDVMNYLFTLLAHKKTFIDACQLIEDMLQSRKEVLDLHKISKIFIFLTCTKLIMYYASFAVHSKQLIPFFKVSRFVRKDKIVFL